MCELSQRFVERHSLQSCVMLLQSTRGQCGTEFSAAGYEAEADGVCVRLPGCPDRCSPNSQCGSSFLSDI